jgi:hypothetical protein
MESEGSLPSSQKPARPPLVSIPHLPKYRYFCKILIQGDALFSEYIDVCTDKIGS